MKIAILNDTHWGARNDNSAIAEHQIKFYREVFFPYLRENDIKTIFHLGDVTDRRKYINFVTAKNLEDHFMKVCADEGIELSIFPTMFLADEGIGGMSTSSIKCFADEEREFFTSPIKCVADEESDPSTFSIAFFAVDGSLLSKLSIAFFADEERESR